MNILIIGGSGHVSGTLARAALAQGHQVWTITRGRKTAIDGVIALTVDRHDQEGMASLIARQRMTWDLVVDCICYDPADMRQDLELFRERAAHFVLITTDFVYDPALRRFPQPEETVHYISAEGGSEYGYKKRLCEMELINAEVGDMAWTIFRPCHIYGPTSELGCLPLHGRDPQLIDKLRKGQPIKLVGGGHFLQQPILAADLAQTILSAAGNKKAHRRILNTAGPNIIESREYYHIIADVLGVGLKVTEVPVAVYRADHDDAAPFLCHRIYETHGLAECGLSVPSTPIKEGLRLHVKGLMARQARV